MAVVSLALGGAPARATFDEDGFHIEEISAYTLRHEELKVGPGAVRLGLFDQLQIGTTFGLNLLGALNGDLKWQIYRTPAFALGVESGVIHFDPRLVGVDTDFSVTAVPLKLNVSFSAGDVFLVHLKLHYLFAEPGAQAPDAALRLQRFLGPVGRLAGEIYLEWRFSNHFALVLEYAAPFMMHAPELLYPTEDPHDRVGMMRVALSLLATFESFNFRAGLGYGPSFLGEQGFFPLIDLYWRIF